MAGAGKNVLRYDRDYYYPEAGVLTQEEMRAEYTRLRTLAMGRLTRLGKTEYREWNVYRYNVDRFAPARDLTCSQLEHALYEVSKFVTSRASLVSGARAIEKAQFRAAKRSGLDVKDISDFRKFGEFMKYARAQYSAKTFDSERARKLFNTAQRKGIDPETMQHTSASFRRWMDDADELERQPKIRSGTADAAAYRRKINRARK